MENMKIQLIRNATIKIKYGGKTILVDPMLYSKNNFKSFVVPNENRNPTIDLPISIEEITKDLDAILVTHLHPDHFDTKAMEVLDKNLPIYVQKGDEELVKKALFTKVEPVTDFAKFDNITIIRTGGKHGPEEILVHLGQVSGYILQAENYPSVYIIGDCIWNEEIENTIKKYNPDIIVTYSGGAIFMGKDRMLMEESETIKVAEAAPNAKIVAVHLEAIDHCAVTRKSLRTLADSSDINPDRLIIPIDGETLTF